MTNFNNQDPRNRTTYNNQDSSTPNPVNSTSGSVNAQPPAYSQPANPAPNQANYRDGYYQGLSERREDLRSRENESAASGILIGLLLAGLTALGLGTYFFLNQDNRPQIFNPTIVVPKASPNPSPQVRERVIERDRVVPVPQQQSAPAPQVRINLPTQPAPTQQAPTQQAPTQPAPAQPAQGTDSTTQPAPSGN